MRTLSWAALVWLVVACGTKDNAATPPPPMDMGQAGSGGSDGTGTEDAAADTGGIVPCGTISCGAGEYCCDGTCGACMAVGMNCPADPCGTDGAAAASE
jgi:hypothetical protein